MQKRWVYVLGVWLILIPLTGVPNLWRNIFLVITGVIVILVAMAMSPRAGMAKKSPQETTQEKESTNTTRPARGSRISQIKNLFARRQSKTPQTSITASVTNQAPSTISAPKAVQSKPSTIAKLATTVTSQKTVDTKEAESIQTQQTNYLDQPLDEVTDDTTDFHDNGAPVLNKDFLQRISDE